MGSEWVEPVWRRRRGIRKIHVLGIASALLAAGAVFSLFNQLGAVERSQVTSERQLIGSIDLRIGNPAVVAERGEAQARLDIEAGLLKLRTFGPQPAAAGAAEAQRLQQRYGITRVHKGDAATPTSQAYADGYNRVMRAEIERRHGSELAGRLMRELNIGAPVKDQKDSP